LFGEEHDYDRERYNVREALKVSQRFDFFDLFLSKFEPPTHEFRNKPSTCDAAEIWLLVHRRLLVVPEMQRIPQHLENCIAPARACFGGAVKTVAKLLFAFVLVMVICASQRNLQAECGDYVIIAGRVGHMMAHARMGHNGDVQANRISPFDAPAPVPCHGPSCKSDGQSGSMADATPFVIRRTSPGTSTMPFSRLVTLVPEGDQFISVSSKNIISTGFLVGIFRPPRAI
jgi:hypothetical protein